MSETVTGDQLAAAIVAAEAVAVRTREAAETAWKVWEYAQAEMVAAQVDYDRAVATYRRWATEALT
jgi:hypothetical protein